MLTPPEDILILLGYGAKYAEFLPMVTNLPLAIGNRLDGLVTSLKAIDDALSVAPLDSMAVKVDKLELSYSQHITLMKKEASRMLKEISALVLLPVVYDRYAGRSPLDTRSVSHNFVSYW